VSDNEITDMQSCIHDQAKQIAKLKERVETLAALHNCTLVLIEENTDQIGMLIKMMDKPSIWDRLGFGNKKGS
jgi:hypothetical protein